MANISKAFYGDVTAARRQSNNERKSVVLVRLTKSGQQSKMAEDTHYFNTVSEAQEYIERVAKLNPTRSFQYQTIIR